MANEFLSLKSVNMQYYGGYVGLDNVSFDMNEGETLCIYGKQFSGKTNLAHTIAGIEKPSSGNISLRGNRLNLTSARELDFALTFGEDSLMMRKTVLDNIIYPLSLRKIDREQSVKIAREITHKLGLDDKLNFYVKSLDSASRRLCIVARSFARECVLYIIDNPFEGIDEEVRRQLFAKMLPLFEGKSVIYLTDSISETLAISQRNIILYGCKVVDNANFDEIVQYPTHIESQIFVAEAKIIEQIDREQINREQIDKEQTDGEQTDGEQTDSEQTDKEQIDSEYEISQEVATLKCENNEFFLQTDNQKLPTYRPKNDIYIDKEVLFVSVVETNAVNDNANASNDKVVGNSKTNASKDKVVASDKTNATKGKINAEYGNKSAVLNERNVMKTDEKIFYFDMASGYNITAIVEKGDTK